MSGVPRSRRFTVLAVAVLLVVAGGVTPVSAFNTGEAPDRLDSGQAPVSASQAGTSEPIGLVVELRLLPDRPGEISVRLTYAIPAGVGSLRTQLPPEASVTSTQGFTRRGSEEFEWDHSTVRPQVTYRLPVNETIEATGPIAGRGDYAFVDTGQWALVEIPQTPTSWTRTSTGPTEVSKQVTIAGDGAVGDAIAFLGNHHEVRRSAHGQRFRLIVPAQAKLAEPESEILDSVAAASSALQVGDRDAEVFMVAAPTGPVRWGVRGLQIGESSYWVRDTERLDTADNVWIHEYVHTRQAYAAGTDVRWFTEGSATFYAALLTLEQSRIGFDAFRDRLGIGARPPTSGAVLAEPATWDGVAPYLKGTLVAGEVDRRLRVATDRSGSLQDVFYRMNQHPGTVSGATFNAMVHAIGGEAVADLARRYISTGDAPTVWGPSEHDRAFGGLPAQMRYRVVGQDGVPTYGVSGPYREEEHRDRRPRLATGETLRFDVRVENVGGSAGEYEAQLMVDGVLQARQTGRLGAGNTTTVQLTHRFTEPGEYAVSMAEDQLEVSVRKPAEPMIDGLEVVPATTRPNGSVQAIATVRNDAEYPARGNLTLYVNDAPVETRQVVLAPTETRTLTFNHTLATGGEHGFRIGDETSTVTVERTPEPPTETVDESTETPSGRANGFGMSIALMALVVFLLVRRLHRG